MDGAVEVVLVEDNPDDVALTLRGLRRAGLVNHIEVLRDGAEALQFFLARGASIPSPMVILLDLQLPKVDGLQVLERLRADPRTQALPVVVLTASRQERDRVESRRLGIKHYITKPVDFPQLAAVVQQLGLYWLLLSQPPQSVPHLP
jgi:two-component system, response regulator